MATKSYVESLFRTCKYRPAYPAEGLATLDDARAWILRFVAWYNTEHWYSGLNFVTPEQRHTAQADHIMKRRIEICEAARSGNPHRWSGAIGDWSMPRSLWLNPAASVGACRHLQRGIIADDSLGYRSWDRNVLAGTVTGPRGFAKQSAST